MVLTPFYHIITVAPLHGCVDWNIRWKSHFIRGSNVAPLHGCVDWNSPFDLLFRTFQSHPYMGAWIETSIRGIDAYVRHGDVAPLHGCVDWNIPFARAWRSLFCRTLTWVRGLKRSCATLKRVAFRRTLTWVRGLKRAICVSSRMFCGRSHPYMGAWIETVYCLFSLFFVSAVAPLHGCVDWNTSIDSV